jgi:hypothetical protein
MIGQWKDNMIINLSQGRAVSSKNFLTLSICFQYALIYVRRVPNEPCQESGPEIETDLFVIVHKLDDAALPVQNPGCGIRRIAFRCNPFIPIMIRMGCVLELHSLKPWIFTRGLVEVTVNADVPLHIIPSPLFYNYRYKKLI